MTSDKETTAAERTAAAMHDTADKLEVAEAILHHSAERSPDTGTTARLHALGDQVTAQARNIDRRAAPVPGRRRPLVQACGTVSRGFAWRTLPVRSSATTVINGADADPGRPARERTTKDCHR